MWPHQVFCGQNSKTVRIRSFCCNLGPSSTQKQVTRFFQQRGCTTSHTAHSKQNFGKLFSRYLLGRSSLEMFCCCCRRRRRRRMMAIDDAGAGAAWFRCLASSSAQADANCRTKRSKNLQTFLEHQPPPPPPPPMLSRVAARPCLAGERCTLALTI